jgi:hypothetical protein
MQNPSQTNGDNINNVRSETSSTFRNKKGISLKRNELQTAGKKVSEPYIEA